MKIFNKKKELKKIDLKQNKNTYIKKVSISLACLILIVGIIMFTFAKFESTQEYTLINGKLGDFSSGDVNISYVVDGVSQNNPPSKTDGYVIKNIDCTNATGTWDYNIWGLITTNMTGKVKCNLEFETATVVSVTLHGAPGAVIEYTDTSGHHSQTLDSTGKKENIEVGILPQIEFEDTTVAKNPNNLSENYTKTVNVSFDTTDINVMPDDALYWYGYISDKVQVISSANGWSSDGYGSFVNPSLNSNNFSYNVGNGSSAGYGTKQPVTANTFHIVCEAYNSTAKRVNVAWSTTKKFCGNTSGCYQAIYPSKVSTLEYFSYDISSKQNNYISFGGVHLTAGAVYAAWIE